jgi:alpha-methylacyl-CoA racemase
MGPLAGVKVLEFEAIGPGPFCGMMLADMGAEVLLVDRPDDPRLGFGRDRWFDVMMRGRRSVTLDLKSKGGVQAALALASRADALIEGFRPGVMERLGLGPDALLARNPKLVYGRMTGWGQEGPLAQAAGHDINYISVTGALAAIGPKERPVPPLNLVGDFGGGALYLVVGVLAALLEAKKSGKGQVVDAAMCDGAASLMSMFFDMTAIGRWTEGRERNFLDGGAHFYGVYECACGNFISIGSIEPQFYALLRQLAGLSDAGFDAQMDPKGWPALKQKLVEVFKSKTREEWCKIMEGTDVCFAPILTMAEAPKHPHMAARKIFVTRHGITQPAPAPRFSRTPSAIREPSTADIGELTREWKAAK